jgi:hypothetical protein
MSPFISYEENKLLWVGPNFTPIQPKCYLVSADSFGHIVFVILASKSGKRDGVLDVDCVVFGPCDNKYY